MARTHKSTIFFTGGGTGGSVTPLLAVAHEVDAHIHWIGTKNGPEHAMVTEAGYEFTAIAAGKLRRYISWRTLFDPLWVLIGFMQSLWLVIRYQPTWIVSAGAYVSVPVAWAGWLLGCKVFIHQQDVRPGLANKLMRPVATVVTVALAKSARAYGKKARVVGNPVRGNLQKIPTPAAARKALGLHSKKPVVLVFGGGTGATFINELVRASARQLCKSAQIVHLNGSGKATGSKGLPRDYHSFEFFNAEEMARAYAAADLVIARAGLGTITELSYLKKPAIIIPMPNTHQVDNARFLETHEAARVLDQPVLEKEFFIKEVTALLQNTSECKQFGEHIGSIMPHNAAKTIAEILRKE